MRCLVIGGSGQDGVPSRVPLKPGRSAHSSSLPSMIMSASAGCTAMEACRAGP